MVIADSSKTYVYDDTTVKVEDEATTIIFDSNADTEESVTLNTSVLEEAVVKEKAAVQEQNVMVSEEGTEYYTIGIINIPEIELSYPILSTCTDELLRISPCKFWGCDPNEVGNFCVIAHNYRNNKFYYALRIFLQWI